MPSKKKKWEVNVLCKIDHKLQWTKIVHSCVDQSTPLKKKKNKYPDLTTILINLNTE